MPQLSENQREIAKAAITRLQEADVQEHLRPGFEQDFAADIVRQWDERQWISFEGYTGGKSQLQIVNELIERAEERANRPPSAGPRRSSRRYEGWGRGRR